ncbi:MAG: hypothetical protein NVSMB59_21490 [Vulcanimicrobiaceae bacterium]
MWEHPYRMTHLFAAALPAFLASLVEFVEALTIVLAVGVTRGWRSALLGTLGATTLLAALVLAFGPALDRVPIAVLQLAIGILLLFFGLRWLRKAVLRYAGAIALHDEATIYAKQMRLLEAAAGRPERIDWIGFITAFKAVALEGLEVVFIVIALGATAGALVPASLGAAVAGVVVVGLGLALHRPLATVPENSLKAAVGVMLSAFGTFWTGEGLHVQWPGADLILIALASGYAAAAALAYVIARGAVRARSAATVGA